jgi:hypothetical protein
VNDQVQPDPTAPETAPEAAPGGSVYSPDSGTFQKSLNLLQGRTEAIVVEMPQWERLERRVKALENLWSIDWLAAAASAAASTAIGCLIAAISLPSGEESGIGPAVEPSLLIGAAVTFAMALVLIALHFRVSKDRTRESTDIIDEMETYEKSFELKKASREIEGLGASPAGTSGSPPKGTA